MRPKTALLNTVQQHVKHVKSVLYVPDCPGPASWAWRRRGWPTETTWAAGWRPEDKLKTPDLDLNATQKKHILTCLITLYSLLKYMSTNIFTCIRCTNSAILFNLFFFFWIWLELNWQPPTFEKHFQGCQTSSLVCAAQDWKQVNLSERTLCKGQIHESPVWEYFSPVYKHWCVLPIWSTVRMGRESL